MDYSCLHSWTPSFHILATTVMEAGFRLSGCFLMGVVVALLLVVPSWGSTSQGRDWVGRFGYYQPSAVTSGKCATSDAGLPKFSVTPAVSGKQLVRISLPFPAGSLPENYSGPRCQDNKSAIFK